MERGSSSQQLEIQVQMTKENWNASPSSCLLSMLAAVFDYEGIIMSQDSIIYGYFLSQKIWRKTYLGYIRLLLTSCHNSNVSAGYVAVNKTDNGPNLLESTFQFGNINNGQTRKYQVVMNDTQKIKNNFKRLNEVYKGLEDVQGIQISH